MEYYFDRRYGKTENEFFMQLFLDPDTVVSQNTQSLLHKMFMKEHITFESVSVIYKFWYVDTLVEVSATCMYVIHEEWKY